MNINTALQWLNVKHNRTQLQLWIHGRVTVWVFVSDWPCYYVIPLYFQYRVLHASQNVIKMNERIHVDCLTHETHRANNAESVPMPWQLSTFLIYDRLSTVYPKKYAHGFVVLCFVVVMQSFIMNSQCLSIFIRVALLALEQSLDCHSASEVSLMDMGKAVNV